MEDRARTFAYLEDWQQERGRVEEGDRVKAKEKTCC